MLDDRVIIKEGILYKRGEHIKNWRQRYFILLSDGSFIGYKTKPDGTNIQESNNNFTVRECQIMKCDKPRPNSFIIRGLQWTTVVERVFSVQLTEERDEWVHCISEVSKNLKAINYDSDQMQPRYFKKKSMDDFKMIKVLGRGTFGKVVLSSEKSTGQLCAIKILKKSVIIAKDEVMHTLTEKNVLQTTKHNYLTDLLYSFQTADRLYFVMEYVNGGELYIHLSREKVFSESRSMFYAAEIISAISYLHTHNIIYRDLKLENILLDQYGHVKIADFGLCKEEMFYGSSTKTFCGTPEYLAPEIVDDNDYNRSVDWWGLGIVMYEMICGRLPFYSNDHETLFRLILLAQMVFPSTISPNAKNLIEGLLNKDPNRRLGSGVDDADSIKRHAFFASIDWDMIEKKEIPPAWIPNVTDSADTRYIPDEFLNESIQLTPPQGVEDMDGNFPYFQSFSYHGRSYEQ